MSGKMETGKVHNTVKNEKETHTGATLPETAAAAKVANRLNGTCKSGRGSHLIETVPHATQKYTER